MIYFYSFNLFLKWLDNILKWNVIHLKKVQHNNKLGLSGKLHGTQFFLYFH
jgi:hypothetical protein